MFKTAKQDAVMGEHEISSWYGCYSHITLSMLELSYLSVLYSACHDEDEEKMDHRFSSS